eukprot:CAMPEP_0168765386 /NCGR_PEP_ID=MMETSP0725-20121227/297_1 /TAXON_ID=265536 /ORGANISM="Amphiprora sp., Strain CCMP467" /LENGTH=248 /DNA_ID=CAMNT_0008814637 /DNA_START=11 /DNA_END=757 /DNA_ORIENTATION=-
MNLASPAPTVEQAEAAPAPREASARANHALQSEAVQVEPAPRVDAATPVDDPRSHAPANVVTAATKSMEQAQQELGVEAFRALSPAGKLDFESYAAVIRGGPQKNIFRKCLPCVFDERDFVAYGEVKHFVGVLGQSCIVYAEETSQKPYYAIDLTQFTALQEDSDNPDPQSWTISPDPDTNRQRRSLVNILLKTKKERKQAFQFTFDTEDDPSLAKRFLDVVTATKNTKEKVVDGVLVEEGKGSKTTM